jgi:hypothetical protein
MEFMDDFALRVGRRFPLHVPKLTKPQMKLIVREEHMQQVALAMPASSPRPRVPGWKPVFPDYRAGLDQVIEAWNE